MVGFFPVRYRAIVKLLFTIAEDCVSICAVKAGAENVCFLGGVSASGLLNLAGPDGNVLTISLCREAVFVILTVHPHINVWGCENEKGHQDLL